MFLQLWARNFEQFIFPADSLVAAEATDWKLKSNIPIKSN